MMLFLLLFGCGPSNSTVEEEDSQSTDSDPAAPGDTQEDDTDARDTGDVDTADPVDAVGCVNLREGPWAGLGRAFGMPMMVTLMRATGSCAFTFEDWSMQHGSVPTGGLVEEDRVRLEGPDPWPTCEGVATSSRSFAGQCAETGKEFEFAYDG